MATQGEGSQPPADNQQAASTSAASWGAKIGERYRNIKEHAENYPYVWASYILVYGGFGLWFAYRWRKLRKTEDRVRTLQARLRELVEAEESANSKAVNNKARIEESAGSKAVNDKAPPSADKPST